MAEPLSSTRSDTDLAAAGLAESELAEAELRLVPKPGIITRTSHVLWDLPLRLFHWSLFMLIVAAVATVKIGGDAMVWHGQIGRLILALLSFRLVWGFVGGRYARFRQFPLAPTQVMAYLRGRWRGWGHNPLGAWSVLAMLAVVSGFAASGPFIGDDAAFLGPLVRTVTAARSEALHAWHQSLEWPLYALVALHLAAIALYQRRGRNLLGPMRHGRVESDPTIGTPPADRTGVRTWALLLALTFAAATWWASGGSWVPPPEPPPTAFDW